jgi:hypothetical protein
LILALTALVAIHLVCVTPSVFVALNSLILATNITYAIIKCTPFVQVATYATRHFATFGLAPAAAPILLMLVISTPIRAIPQIIGICMRLKVTPLSAYGMLL